MPFVAEQTNTLAMVLSVPVVFDSALKSTRRWGPGQLVPRKAPTAAVLYQTGGKY
jgi:hypothetical protein